MSKLSLDIAFLSLVILFAGYAFMLGQLIASSLIIVLFFNLYVFIRWPKSLSGGADPFLSENIHRYALYAFFLLCFLPSFAPLIFVGLNLDGEKGSQVAIFHKIAAIYNGLYQETRTSWIFYTWLGFIQIPEPFDALEDTDITQSETSKIVFFAVALQNLATVVIQYFIGGLLFLRISLKRFLLRDPEVVRSVKMEICIFIIVSFCCFFITWDVLFGKRFNISDQFFKFSILHGCAFLIPLLLPFIIKSKNAGDTDA